MKTTTTPAKHKTDVESTSGSGDSNNTTNNNNNNPTTTGNSAMFVPELQQHGERTSTTNETPSLVHVPIPPSPVDLDSSNQTSVRVNLNDTPSSFGIQTHPFQPYQTYPMRSPPTPTTPPFPVSTFHQHLHRYNTPPQSTYPTHSHSHHHHRKQQTSPHGRQHGTLSTPQPSSPPYLHQQQTQQRTIVHSNNLQQQQSPRQQPVTPFVAEGGGAGILPGLRLSSGAAVRVIPKDVCRHYLAGTCSRNNCRFVHPPPVPPPEDDQPPDGEEKER